MSADNLWLLRHRDGQWYVTMEYASMLMEQMPAGPQNDAIAKVFGTEDEALNYCAAEEQGSNWTEYGIVYETEIPELIREKRAYQDDLRRLLNDTFGRGNGD